MLAFPRDPPAKAWEAPIRFKIDKVPGHSAVAFQLLHNDGRPLLSSRRFTNHDACIVGARVAIDRMDARASYALRKSANGIRLLLLDDDRRELARSRTFDTSDEARELRDELILESEDHDDYELIHTTGSRPLLDLQLNDDVTEAATTLPPESYDFTKTSLSGEQGFELYRNDQRDTWGFHFNDANGQVMMYGPESPSQGARTKMLQQVVRHAANLGRFQRRDEGGSWTFYLVDRDMMELARSRPYDDAAELERAIHFANAFIPSFAERFGAKLPAKLEPDGFSVTITATDESPGPVLMMDADGKPIFVINDDAGKPLLFSQPYSSPRSRDGGLKTTLRRMADRTCYELQTTDDGAHFVVRSDNGRALVRSRDFAEIDELHLLMSYALSQAPAWCATWGVELDESDTEVITVTGRRERKKVEEDFEAPEPGLARSTREQGGQPRPRRDAGIPAMVGGPSAALGSEDKPPSAPLGSQEPAMEEVDKPMPPISEQRRVHSNAYDDDEVTMARATPPPPREDTDARFSPTWYQKAFSADTSPPQHTDEVTIPFVEGGESTADLDLEVIPQEAFIEGADTTFDSESSAPDHVIRVALHKHPEASEESSELFDRPTYGTEESVIPMAAAPAEKHPLDSPDSPDPETDDVTGFSMPSLPSRPAAPAQEVTASLQVALSPQPVAPPIPIAPPPAITEEVPALPPAINEPADVPGEVESLRSLRAAASSSVDDEDPLDYQPQRTPAWVWGAASAVTVLALAVGVRTCASTGTQVAAVAPAAMPAPEPTPKPVAAAAAPVVEEAQPKPEPTPKPVQAEPEPVEEAEPAPEPTPKPVEADDGGDAVAAIAPVDDPDDEPTAIVQKTEPKPQPTPRPVKVEPKPEPVKVQAEPKPRPTPKPQVERKPERTPPPSTTSSAPTTPAGTVAMPDGSTFQLRSGSPEDRISSWLQSGKTGTKIFRLQRHTFDEGSAETGAAGAEEIWLIGQLLKAHPNAQIHIRGHRDGAESVAYSGGERVRYADSLSMVRAHTMLRRLRHQGVSSSQLSIQDRGSSKPLTAGTTERERRQNRRIEVAITL